MVQAKLLETIPNVIAISWQPEGGDNQLAAVVEDVARRLPAFEKPGLGEGSTSGSRSVSDADSAESRFTPRLRRGSLSNKTGPRLTLRWRRYTGARGQGRGSQVV